MKGTDALLDVDTNEVICQECGKPITNISSVMKKTLKSMGQIVRNNVKKAFMMACKNCNANREVVLDSTNNTVCKVCGTEIKVHAAMKQAMVELSKINKED